MRCFNDWRDCHFFQPLLVVVGAAVFHSHFPPPQKLSSITLCYKLHTLHAAYLCCTLFHQWNDALKVKATFKMCITWKESPTIFWWKMKHLNILENHALNVRTTFFFRNHSVPFHFTHISNVPFTLSVSNKRIWLNCWACECVCVFCAVNRKHF